MKTAILVDGGFYQRRAQALFGSKPAKERAVELESYCRDHIKYFCPNAENDDDLYRIFYYDCPPMTRKVYHPFLKKQFDFSKTEHFSWMNEFLDALRNKRKFAVRLGKLSESQAGYQLRPEVVKKLCNGKMSFDDLTDQDFEINLEQKGVDMRIGLDIASMAYKKQVQRIVLISGDSDFVPAAKLARREGIDFILDPMWAPVKPELNEHIDGLHSCCDRPKPKEKQITGKIETGK